MTKSPVIKPLHGLRGMAACTVLVGHLGPITSAPSLGVVLFFILSGFLIGRLYLSRELSSHSVLEYATARIGRVYPLFALVVLAAGAISLLYPAPPRIPFDFSPDQIGDHLLLAGAAPTIWTISVEFQFYVLFVLLWYVLPRSHARPWVLAALVVIFAVCAVHFGADGSRINLLRYLHLFTAGLLISVLVKDGPSPSAERFAGLVLPILLLAYAAAFLAIPRFYDHDQVYADLFACTLCAALITAAVCAPSSWCGKCSAGRSPYGSARSRSELTSFTGSSSGPCSKWSANCRAW